MTKPRSAHPDTAAFFTALGRRIKELRKERGWSLSYMHLTHGYVPSHWQRIERGKTITVDTMLRIADLFDETLVSLVRSLGVFPRRNEERARTPDVLDQGLSKQQQAT